MKLTVTILNVRFDNGLELYVDNNVVRWGVHGVWYSKNHEDFLALLSQKGLRASDGRIQKLNRTNKKNG